MYFLRLITVKKEFFKKKYSNNDSTIHVSLVLDYFPFEYFNRIFLIFEYSRIFTQIKSIREYSITQNTQISEFLEKSKENNVILVLSNHADSKTSFGNYTQTHSN
jgi:hypothetical protein